MWFNHTADWQIGKVLKRFGAKEETLRHARLTTIECLGQAARAVGAGHVLVAGDVYYSDANTITLRAPIDRMKPFAEIHWHLFPGNHDPDRPEGARDCIAEPGLPANALIHLTPAPVQLGDGAFLLAAPLLRKNEQSDLASDEIGPAVSAVSANLPNNALEKWDVVGFEIGARVKLNWSSPAAVWRGTDS